MKNKLIKDILQLGWDIEMRWSEEDNDIRYYLVGFGFKESGCCYLKIKGSEIELIGRYNSLGKIETAKDIESIHKELEQLYSR